MSRKPMTYWTSWHMPKVKLENILISEFCQIFIKVKKIVYFVAKKCRSHFNLTIFFCQKIHNSDFEVFEIFFPEFSLDFLTNYCFPDFFEDFPPDFPWIFWWFFLRIFLHFLIIFVFRIFLMFFFPDFFPDFFFDDFLRIFPEFFEDFFPGFFDNFFFQIFSGFSWKMFTF